MQSMHFIGNDWFAGTTGKTFDCVDPATGQVFATLPAGGAAEVDAAVTAARQAFEGWKATTGTARARILRAIASGRVSREGRRVHVEGTL